MELINNGSEPVKLAWGRFNYTIPAGGRLSASYDVYVAFIKRFPNVKEYAAQRQEDVSLTEEREEAPQDPEPQAVDTEDAPRRRGRPRKLS